MKKNLILKSIKTEYLKLHLILTDLLEKNVYLPDFINEVAVVAEEIFSNIINHSYKKNNKKIIEIDIEVTYDYCKVVFCDYGIEFKNIKIPESLEELHEKNGKDKIGGLGLYIISKFSDFFDIKREGNKNITTFIKYRRLKNNLK